MKCFSVKTENFVAYSQIPFSSPVDLRISKDTSTSFMKVLNNRVCRLELESEAFSDHAKFCCIVAALFALQ